MFRANNPTTLTRNGQRRAPRPPARGAPAAAAGLVSGREAGSCAAGQTAETTAQGCMARQWRRSPSIMGDNDDDDDAAWVAGAPTRLVGSASPQLSRPRTRLPGSPSPRDYFPLRRERASQGDHDGVLGLDRDRNGEWPLIAAGRRQRERMRRQQSRAERILKQQLAAMGSSGLLQQWFSGEYIAAYWQLRASTVSNGGDGDGQGVLGSMLNFNTAVGGVAAMFASFVVPMLFGAIEQGDNVHLRIIPSRWAYVRLLCVSLSAFLSLGSVMVSLRNVIATTLVGADASPSLFVAASARTMTLPLRLYTYSVLLLMVSLGIQAYFSLSAMNIAIIAFAAFVAVYIVVKHGILPGIAAVSVTNATIAVDDYRRRSTD